MATGNVENWLDVDKLGAIYPFVGTEAVLAIVGIVFWVIWHFIQIGKENREFAKDIENIRAKGGPGAVLDEESGREMKDTVGS